MVFFVPIAYCSKNQRKHTIILHESMTLLHWLLTDILKTEYLCLKPGLLFFLFIRSFLSSRVRQDICLGTDQVNTLNFTNYQGQKRHYKLSTLGQSVSITWHDTHRPCSYPTSALNWELSCQMPWIIISTPWQSFSCLSMILRCFFAE